jgi:hypothetical protein
MPSTLLLAPRREAARFDLIKRRLRRYHPRFQETVRGLAMRHTRMADLAVFSGRPATVGHGLIERPWAPDMHIGTAQAAAEAWRMMIALYANLGGEPIAQMWLEAGCVAGYDFLPLSSIAAIAEAAGAMKNCLRTYG